MVVVENYSGGEEGALGLVTTWKPGDSTNPNRVKAPTQWLLAETDGLDSEPDNIERDVYSESRDADKGHRTGKYTVGGPIGTALYPTNGLEMLIGAIGDNTFEDESASTPDTTTAIDNTGDGVTALTLAALTTDYAPPDLVLIDTGAKQQCRPVISWNAATGVLVVPSLGEDITHDAVGTEVVQMSRLFITPYTKASGHSKLLRRMCFEEHVGDNYAQAYPGAQIGKAAIKGVAAKMDVTYDVMCGAQRKELTTETTTAYDDDQASLEELGFEFTDGFMVFPVDPSDTGTPTLQLVSDGQDWSLTIDNQMRKLGNYDGTANYKYAPGLRKIDITFKLLNQASYPVAWTKFLTKNLNVPWFAFMCLNVGTDADPVWQALVFYCPNVRYKKTPENKAIADTIGETVDARALKAGGLEKVYVQVAGPAITAVFDSAGA